MSGRDPPERRSRATSYDVARLAGVSQSAVSRTFTEGASVAPETRERVLAAARTLGYRPNAIARGLITRRSNLVGLLLPAQSSLYYPEVTAQITAEAGRRGSRVLLMTVETPDALTSAIEQLWSYAVDGVVSACALTVEQVEDFEAHRTPVVFFNRPPPHHAGTSVSVDHAEAEGRLVARLWAGGCRRFGLIRGPADSPVAEARAQGAARALAAQGAVFEATAQGDYRYESGLEAFDILWAETGRRLDTVICANDAMALGAMDSARLRHGLSVPDRVSITGFDGFGPGRWLSYQLTTVRQPLEPMASAAVDMLFARIDEPELNPERRLFVGEIVPGRSARLGAG